MICLFHVDFIGHDEQLMGRKVHDPDNPMVVFGGADEGVDELLHVPGWPRLALVHATVDSVFERADAFQVGDQLASFCFVRMATAWRHMQNAKAKKKGKDSRFDRMQNLPKAETDNKHSIPTMLSFQLLLDLPEAQRKTVFLTYVEGYRYREVADILDVPVGTVMNRLAASRKTLQMLSQPRRALKDKTA